MRHYTLICGRPGNGSYAKRRYPAYYFDVMAIELALYQPDIPQNTGTLLRLGACWDVRVHIIHPTGFGFSDKSFRRAAMDYANLARFSEHKSFDAFLDWCTREDRRLVLMTTKAEQSGYEFTFAENDVLLAGRESAGVPDQVAESCAARIRIPMRAELRSINVALASALMLGEAMRQTGQFQGLL